MPAETSPFVELKRHTSSEESPWSMKAEIPTRSFFRPLIFKPRWPLNHDMRCSARMLAMPMRL